MAALDAMEIDMDMPDKDGKRKLNAKYLLRPEYDLRKKSDRRVNQRKRAEAVYKMLHLLDESTTLPHRIKEAGIRKKRENDAKSQAEIMAGFNK